MYDPKKVTRKDIIKFLGDSFSAPDLCQRELDSYLVCIAKFKSSPDSNCSLEIFNLKHCTMFSNEVNSAAKIFKERKRSLIFDMLRIATLRYNTRYNKAIKK